MSSSNISPYMTGPNASPGGATNFSARFNPQRTKPILDGLHNWLRKKPALTPGAYDKAYENLSLAEFTQAGCGAGVIARQFFGVTQPPQLYVGLGTSLTGYGGLAAGQMIMQPLFDPNTQTYGGVPV
jgi:hypothetical protein